MGGFGPSRTPFDSIEIFDMTTYTVSTSSFTLPSARSEFAVWTTFVLGNPQICLFGGIGSFGIIASEFVVSRSLGVLSENLIVCICGHGCSNGHD